MEKDQKRAEGKLQQLVGNGILGCCNVALPYPVCWGGVLGCSGGTSWLCLLWSWHFRMLLGSSIMAAELAFLAAPALYCLFLCQGSC